MFEELLMMLRSPLLLVFGLVWCLMVGTTAHADTQEPGIALRPLSQTHFDTQRLMSLCKLQTPACDPSTTKAYVRRQSDDGFVYLIDVSKPMLIRVRRQAANEAGMSWNFTAHIPTYQTLENAIQPGQGLGLNKPEIYPALYQVDATSWAIALIQTKNFMYSGGGGGNVAADFLELSTNGVLPGSFDYKPLYLGVPFSSSNITRSCFNEKDHADLEHHRRLSCQDEHSAYLTIRFADSQASHGPWLFTWHSFFQSSLSAKEHRKQHIPFEVKDDEDLKTKDFRLATYFVNQ